MKSKGKKFAIVILLFLFLHFLVVVAVNWKFLVGYSGNATVQQTFFNNKFKNNKPPLNNTSPTTLLFAEADVQSAKLIK